MTGLLWAGLAAAGAVTVWAVYRRAAARASAAGLGDVVADAFGRTWAERLRVTETRVRTALTGGDDVLLARVAELTGRVSCSFRRDDGPGQGHLVVVAVRCDHRDGGEDRVTMRVPWRRVPAAVRTELLGARGAEVLRTWSPAGNGTRTGDGAGNPAGNRAGNSAGNGAGDGDGGRAEEGGGTA
jgi:hypothetical protein